MADDRTAAATTGERSTTACLSEQLPVDDLAQHARRVGAVQVDAAVHVLHEAGRDDDDLVAAGADVLDAQVDHAAQVRVARLEQLGRGEEHLAGLLLRLLGGGVERGGRLF